MNLQQCQYFPSDLQPTSIQESPPKCKYCGTTTLAHFYKSNRTTCKICKDPKNRAEQKTSISQSTATQLKCKLCEVVKPITDFDMSISGFRYSKCRICRTSKGMQALTLTQNEYKFPMMYNPDLIEYIPTGQGTQVQWKQSTIDKYTQWKHLVNMQKYSQEDIDILITILQENSSHK